MTDRLGVYLHIPFCKSRCIYCDFCSSAGREGDMAAYVDALLAEVRATPIGTRRVTSVYLGGGTPTLLPSAELSRLLHGLRACYAIADDAEITCEMNPKTADREKLSLLLSLGVNRLSIGVQSLSDRALSLLGRAHTADDAVAAVGMARSAGFRNISVDVMTGLPGESEAELLSTLRGILALAPEHISAYALTVEPGTPLARSPLLATLPDEDAAADAMALVNRVLGDGGYRHYEISNYARSGFESRHNLGYWRREEYLGFGVAAYSYFGGVRYGKPRDLDGYLARRPLPRVDEEIITPAEREREAVMLSLRLAEGIDRQAYLAEFGRDPALLFAPVISHFPGGFCVSDSSLSLTEEGMAVSNTLIAACLSRV